MVKTIEFVVKNQLCTGCGTCFALCPSSAIQIKKDKTKGIFVAKVDYEKCNRCGICYQVCPGHSVDFEQINQAVFTQEPEDILVGNYINCYIGHAIDYDIRYNSTSGGLITALLIFALKEGIINGALVTRMKINNPLEPEPFIARTRDEIIDASKSKYCPVPANIALKEIFNSKEGEKFAVVGLPCHIQGIRKAEQVNKKLREKIILHIGLFCSHTPNFLGTDILLTRIKVKKEDVTKIDYRGEGWPGHIKISLKNGESILQNHWAFVGLDFFTPHRCLMCCDILNDLADISFGDAWLPELSDKIGKSIVISRTMFSEAFLQGAMYNIIELDQVTSKEAKRSQLDTIYLKRKSLKAYSNLFRWRPQFNTTFLEPDYMDYLLSVSVYINRLFSQNQIARLLLKHLPQKVISLYLLLYHIPLNIVNKKLQKLQDGNNDE